MKRFNVTDTVAIIGAGISGLTAAYKLSKQGIKVTVFEKQNNIGGQLAAIELNNTFLEVYYHHAFSSDTSLWDLCNELGLYNNVIWLESKMGYFAEESLFEFGTPISLLKFKPLSLKDKINFGLSLLKLKSIKDIKYTERFTSKEWFIQNAGEKVWNIIWKPLFQLKFDNLYDQISLTWIWDKLKIRGNSRSKNRLKEKLAYMKGSYFLICQKLEQEIIKNGGQILKNITIEKIENHNHRFTLLSKNNNYKFDKVISTTSSKIMKNLYNFGEIYNNKLSNLDYCSAICTLLVSNKPLSKFYWINIGDSSLPFGGIIEHTNIYDKSHYNNKHIIYISRYLKQDEELFNTYTDQQILDLFYEGLKKINPEFDRTWIEAANVFKNKYAQPIVKKGYIKPSNETEIDGLYWLSTHHTYPHDRGINYAIKFVDELLS